MVHMDSSSIALPVAPPPTRRPPLPFIAAIVPVAAGVVLWLVSGSIYALCFAALGPLMLVASLVDGARNRRRERRTTDADLEVLWNGAEQELTDRRRDVAERLWHRHPDAAACLAQRPLRGPEPLGPATEVVIGRGTVPSGIHTTGGEGARGREFQARCAKLPDAPVRVLLGRGLCLRGPRPVVAAVARAVAVQLWLRFGAAHVVVDGDGSARPVADGDEGGAGRLRDGRVRTGAFRLAIVAPDSVRTDADAVIWILPTDADVPEGITTVVDIVEPGRALVRTPERTVEVAAEGVSRAQFAAVLREGGGEASAVDAEDVPLSVSLRDLSQRSAPHGLPATIGRGGWGEVVVVDIVADGPHAIVIGMTGSGKSELLVSWVTAIAQANGPDRVSFVLVDFKGGTSFEPLRALRQVAAVITDLEEDGARRGVSSLTAELRRREALLAAAGARDVSEVAIPRLVIVVDEFAALLQEHPDLGAVFTDVAARGRALGMHLILGTQRASGVIRDGLATNCPLRIGLRVVDAADSRLVIGSAAAAEIAGGQSSRGRGFVRRPQDVAPVAVRVARTDAADLRETATRWEDSDAAPAPWLPSLPTVLPLGDLADDAMHADALVLGRADDPEHQRQPTEMLRAGADRGIAILGASGAGRTSALRVLAAQRPDAVWVSGDPEEAWDALAAWAGGTQVPGALVLCDDLDLLVARFPPDHGQMFLRNWEQVIRTAAQTTFAITASRSAGPVGRVLEALPLRALLRMSSRVEHLTAGGDGESFLRTRPSGRARIDVREVQIAWVEETAERSAPRDNAPRWSPGSGITAIVTPNAPAIAQRLRADHPHHEVVVLGESEPLARPTPVDAAAHTVRLDRLIVGDAETWQRRGTVLQRARLEGGIIVRVEHPSELRLLAGMRSLPPYALSHAGRAWVVQGDGEPRRVVVPGFTPRAEATPVVPAPRAPNLPASRSPEATTARLRRDHRRESGPV